MWQKIIDWLVSVTPDRLPPCVRIMLPYEVRGALAESPDRVRYWQDGGK